MKLCFKDKDKDKIMYISEKNRDSTTPLRGKRKL